MKRFLLAIVVVLALTVVGSVAVWQLAGDEPRRAAAVAAAVTTDPVALMWRGSWTAEAKFSPGQVVSHNGSAYVAQQVNVGTSPACADTSDNCPWVLMANRGPAGLVGPRGPAGVQGPPGAQGPAGEIGDMELRTAGQDLAGNSTTSLTVECPDGMKAVGGGFRGGPQGLVTESSPDPLWEWNTWVVKVKNTGSVTQRVVAFAFCAPVALD
jgi:hypothetical protein